jgi:hypothetical protein
MAAVGEGDAEDDLVGAGLDVTGHQIGDLVRLADRESGHLFGRTAGGQHLTHLGRVLFRRGQDQRAHPRDVHLGRVTADFGAVAMEHLDLAGERGHVARHVALVGVAWPPAAGSASRRRRRS